MKSLKNGEYEYNQKDKLGEGAFAKVYKGKVNKTGLQIAVRILPLSLIKQFGHKIKEIINGQVNVLKQLSLSNDPDRIFTTKIYDCFLTEKNVTMILELCPDGNLQQIISKRGSIPQGEALQIIYQLARGLEFCSKNKVVHRDIKPDNVFLKKQPNNTILYKIGDFGFAVKKQLNDQTIGTPIFMSPEIFKQQQYGSEVDVWAFGLMCHYILFKEFYFIGQSQNQIKKRVLKQKYQLKAHHKNLISKDMQDFLTQCIQFDKKSRMPATQISKHPVFTKIRPKIEMMMQSVLKNSSIMESKTKGGSIKGKLLNYLTSFHFIYDYSRKLTQMNSFNIASLYLQKYNIGELSMINKRLLNRQNILNLNQKEWKQFVNSQELKQAINYCQKIYSQNKGSYDQLYKYLIPTISQRYSPQVAQGIQANLGKDIHQRMKPEIIVYQLMNTIIPPLRANNTPDNYAMVMETMLVRLMAEGKDVRVDFMFLEINKKTIKLGERTQIIEQQIKRIHQ